VLRRETRANVTDISLFTPRVFRGLPLSGLGLLRLGVLLFFLSLRGEAFSCFVFFCLVEASWMGRARLRPRAWSAFGAFEDEAD